MPRAAPTSATNVQDLIGILALESPYRGKFVVIGEDLGTVTDEVRETLIRAPAF